MKKLLLIAAFGALCFCGYGLTMVELDFNFGGSFANHTPASTVPEKTGYNFSAGGFFRFFPPSREELLFGFGAGFFYSEDNTDYSSFSPSIWEWYHFKWLQFPVCFSLALLAPGYIVTFDAGAFYNMPVNGFMEPSSGTQIPYSLNGQFGIKLMSAFDLVFSPDGEPWPFGLGAGVYAEFGFGDLAASSSETFTILPRLGITFTLPFYFF